jgi:hypothetical protein
MQAKIKLLYFKGSFCSDIYLCAGEFIMTDEKKKNTEILLLEEKRLLSLIKNLRDNVDTYQGVNFSNDLLEAETRLLLLRRVLSVQQHGAFK